MKVEKLNQSFPRALSRCRQPRPASALADASDVILPLKTPCNLLEFS